MQNNDEMYLVGVYDMSKYTVGEIEQKLIDRFGDKAYEAVCDVINGLLRVYAQRVDNE